MNKADFIRQVIEYLSKKGYSRTEAMLRIESASQDAEGRPVTTGGGEAGGVKYGKAFSECHSDSCYVDLTRFRRLDATVY